ncbi:MAG TPA: hypothetical protein VLI93_15800 [Acetobacteraceae bacterium]|nr:hypothetical protein [Acetobacteraceae bacterium]
MFSMPVALDRRMIDQFVGLIGAARWSDRMRSIEHRGAAGPRAGKAILQRYAVECALERLRRGVRAPTAAERRIELLVAEAVALASRLSASGLARWREELGTSLDGDNTLVPAFHKLRSATVQRKRGFDVRFAGLEDGASFDLLLRRDGTEAELACDVISAETGRSMHRETWFRLADRIDADLQTWLASHPGRYLLKMTLPAGLRAADGKECGLARLHGRIRQLLADSRRADHDEALVLRLDPLLLAGAQADDLGMLSGLRREFGPEAQLAVVAGDSGVFVLAARAGQENAVATAIRRRMADIAPRRLTGTRPGILAMFVEDTDRAEWRGLRDRLELEGETRQFLANPEARSVVAVSCTSRIELFGLAEPDAAPDGELRFRNPAHPAARSSALAPAVISSV